MPMDPISVSVLKILRFLDFAKERRVLEHIEHLWVTRFAPSNSPTQTRAVYISGRRSGRRRWDALLQVQAEASLDAEVHWIATDRETWDRMDYTWSRRNSNAENTAAGRWKPCRCAK